VKKIVLAALMASFAFPALASPPEGYSDGDKRFVGSWRALDSDTRKFRIDQFRFGWKMTAPDLDCAITTPEYEEDHFKKLGVLAAKVHFDCADEGTSWKSDGQIELFDHGNYLVTSETMTEYTDMADGGERAKTTRFDQPKTVVHLYRRAK
jgi:hypothetical protein